MNDDDHYRVVRNLEEQYSVWHGAGEVPAGWVPDGFVGTRNDCLDYVDRVWTDMRPKSVREDAS